MYYKQEFTISEGILSKPPTHLFPPIGGRFAPFTILSNKDTDIDSMDTTFNTALTETASEILGKHRQKKKTWVTADILDLCHKRREPRKKRFKPEGCEKYKEVNNNVKRFMKKGKEN